MRVLNPMTQSLTQCEPIKFQTVETEPNGLEDPTPIVLETSGGAQTVNNEAGSIVLIKSVDETESLFKTIFEEREEDPFIGMIPSSKDAQSIDQPSVMDDFPQINVKRKHYR